MSRVSGIAERVRLLVLGGTLPAGELLVEAELVEVLHTRRWTLREALRRLEGDGLLVADHDGGMRVVALDADDVAGALAVRAELEALEAAAAARVAAEADVERLRLLAAALSEAGDRVAAITADRHLHRAIGQLAGNRAARDALERVWDRLTVVAVAGGARPAGGGDHAALIGAIAAGEADEAAALARRHVLGAAVALG